MYVHTFNFIQNYLTNKFLSYIYYKTHNEIVSYCSILLPNYFDISSFSWTFCVVSAQRSFSDQNRYTSLILWCIKYHCDMNSVPAQPLSYSPCAKFCSIKNCWFLSYKEIIHPTSRKWTFLHFLSFL